MWNVADITMGIMAIINILSILLLGGIAIKALRDYERQKINGQKIRFRGEDIGVKDTVWK